MHAMGSLFDRKYSQWGNRFLLITENLVENLRWGSFAKIVSG